MPWQLLVFTSKLAILAKTDIYIYILIRHSCIINNKLHVPKLLYFGVMKKKKLNEEARRLIRLY